MLEKGACAEAVEGKELSELEKTWGDDVSRTMAVLATISGSGAAARKALEYAVGLDLPEGKSIEKTNSNDSKKPLVFESFRSNRYMRPAVAVGGVTGAGMALAACAVDPVVVVGKFADFFDIEKRVEVHKEALESRYNIEIYFGSMEDERDETFTLREKEILLNRLEKLLQKYPSDMIGARKVRFILKKNMKGVLYPQQYKDLLNGLVELAEKLGLDEWKMFLKSIIKSMFPEEVHVAGHASFNGVVTLNVEQLEYAFDHEMFHEFLFRGGKKWEDIWAQVLPRGSAKMLSGDPDPELFERYVEFMSASLEAFDQGFINEDQLPPIPPGFASYYGVLGAVFEENAAEMGAGLLDKSEIVLLIDSCRMDPLLRIQVEILTGCKLNLLTGRFDRLYSEEEYEQLVLNFLPRDIRELITGRHCCIEGNPKMTEQEYANLIIRLLSENVSFTLKQVLRTFLTENPMIFPSNFLQGVALSVFELRQFKDAISGYQFYAKWSQGQDGKPRMDHNYWNALMDGKPVVFE